MLFSKKDSSPQGESLPQEDSPSSDRHPLPSPEQCLGILYGKIPPQARIAFVAAILAGLAAHLYQFTNKLYNYDELLNTPGGYGLTTELGRWFLQLLSKAVNRLFYGNYSLPLLTGLISLLLLAASAALMVSAFQIKSRLSAALIGMLAAVFPAVTSMYCFMFTAAFYALANFLSVLSAYLVIQFPRNVPAHIAAVILLACSLGTYQAYFPNTVCMLLICVLFQCAFSKDEVRWKDILCTALRYVAVLLAGLILYFLLNRFFKNAWGIEAMDYQGVSAMGQISLRQLAAAIVSCYRSFLGLLGSNVMGLTPTRLIQRCLLASLFVFAATMLIVILRRHGAIKTVFMLCVTLLLPVAFFLIYIMAPDSYQYTLMAYPAVFFPIFLLGWADRFHGADVPSWLKSAAQWIVTISSAAVVCVYVWFANGCYMGLEYTKYHDMSYYQAIVTQIKSLDGYSDDLPVIFVGNDVPDDATAQAGNLFGGIFSIGGASGTNLGGSHKYHIMNDYLGFSANFGTYEDILEWMGRDEVKEMPCYPDDGSIQIIDDTVIVKISDYELEAQDGT